MYSSPSGLRASRATYRTIIEALTCLGRIARRITVLRYVTLLLLVCGWNTVMAGQHDPKTDKVTRKGADIYRHYCSVCHGDRGDGQSRARRSFATPPRNYTTAKAAQDLTRKRMINSVTNGRPGTAMISWKTELTAVEIAAVVDYIRTTFMRLDDIETNRPKPSDKLLASRGGVLYMRACAMCHGETGKRVISGRMQPPPTNFILPISATQLTTERMIASIANGRPGTAMKAYGDEYSKADIKAMAEFIRAAFMTKEK